jgi:hypothetical protein
MNLFSVYIIVFQVILLLFCRMSHILFIIFVDQNELHIKNYTNSKNKNEKKTMKDKKIIFCFAIK